MANMASEDDLRHAAAAQRQPASAREDRAATRRRERVKGYTILGLLTSQKRLSPAAWQAGFKTFNLLRALSTDLSVGGYISPNFCRVRLLGLPVECNPNIPDGQLAARLHTGEVRRLPARPQMRWLELK